MKIKDRLNSESPGLFKSITNLCVGIGSCGFAIMATSKYFEFPNLVLTASGYMIAIGVVGASISKLTVKDK